MAPSLYATSSVSGNLQRLPLCYKLSRTKEAIGAKINASSWYRNQIVLTAKSKARGRCLQKHGRGFRAYPGGEKSRSPDPILTTHRDLDRWKGVLLLVRKDFCECQIFDLYRERKGVLCERMRFVKTGCKFDISESLRTSKSTPFQRSIWRSKFWRGSIHGAIAGPRNHSTNPAPILLCTTL